MSKLLIYIVTIASVILAGCDADGLDPVKVRNAVTTAYPKSDVTPIPGSKYKFLVRNPDGTVFYAEYMGMTLNETASAVMFSAR